MDSIRQHLQDLIDAGERADPLVFSGREEEIDRIVRIAGRLPPDGRQGRTMLIQGAPGSGKTALIAEVSTRLAGKPDTGIVSLAADYYEYRLAASRTPIAVVAAVHRLMATESGIRESDVGRTIGTSVQKLDPVSRKEWDARFDARPSECFESLLRSGIVSLDSMYRCASPVPSFSRYILNQVRHEQH